MNNKNISTNDKFVKRIVVKTTKQKGMKIQLKYAVMLKVEDFL